MNERMEYFWLRTTLGGKSRAACFLNRPSKLSLRPKVRAAGGAFRKHASRRPPRFWPVRRSLLVLPCVDTSSSAPAVVTEDEPAGGLSIEVELIVTRLMFSEASSSPLFVLLLAL